VQHRKPAAAIPAGGVIRVGGIDFGTKAIHAVVLSGPVPDLDAAGHRGAAARPPAVERVHLAVGDTGVDELVALCRGLSHVGIDAPDRQTLGCPLGGVRPARCAEVALSATRHGLDERMVGGPLSMLTPSAGAPFPARLQWMKAGFDLWDRLRSQCPAVTFFETWPSGSFTRLARLRRPPVALAARSTARGVAQRASLLEPLVEPPPFLAMWGLDGVDALAAALAAHRVAIGHGFVVAGHRHRDQDGSSITLIDVLPPTSDLSDGDPEVGDTTPP
jgi:hypothetical protein